MLVRCLIRIECARHLHLYLLKVVSFKFDGSDGGLWPFYSALSISSTAEFTSMQVKIQDSHIIQFKSTGPSKWPVEKWFRVSVRVRVR